MKDWGTYRKLYELLSPDFERMPYASRCFAADILRRCDRNGRIVPANEINQKLISDLGFHVRAHTGEEEFLRHALEWLLKDGYVVFSGGYLTIRNFIDAQRSDSAIRMAKLRSRGAEDEAIEDPTEDGPADGTPPPEPGLCDDHASRDAQTPPSYGLVSSGLVSSGSVPDPEKPKSNDKPRSVEKKARDVPGPLPADWAPTDGQLAALAEKHGVNRERILATIREFRWYWLEGPGAVRKQRATLRGWAQTFGNRIDFMARKGDLYADQTSPPRAAQQRGAQQQPKQPNSGWKPRVES